MNDSFSFVHASLIHNDISTISIRMEHSSGGYYSQNQSSNSVVLAMEPGDQVWLQTYSGSLKGYPSPSTTFSGFLISEWFLDSSLVQNIQSCWKSYDFFDVSIITSQLRTLYQFIWKILLFLCIWCRNCERQDAALSKRLPIAAKIFEKQFFANKAIRVVVHSRFSGRFRSEQWVYGLTIFL